MSLSNKKTITGELCHLNPLIGSQGILRVCGHLKNASIPCSQRHPVILHSNSRITELTIMHEHIKLMHASQKFLLANLNQVIG